MSERTLWTLILLAAAGLLGVLAWRRGLLSRFFPPPNIGQQLPFGGGLAPTEYGPAAPGGGMSTFGALCNAGFQTGGTIAIASGHPGAMAGGVVAKAGAPLICAAHEYVAGKVWDGSKWVGGKSVDAGKAIGRGAEKTWNATLGRIF